MDGELARQLATQGVITRDDLADLATDELVELAGIGDERAGELIMAARAAWFEDDVCVRGKPNARSQASRSFPRR